MFNFSIFDADDWNEKTPTKKELPSVVTLICPACGHKATVDVGTEPLCGKCLRLGKEVDMVPVSEEK
jgi:hypothetical protein